MNQEKYIFFFDIDGTLYDHFTGTDEAALNTLKKLKENGHLVCLNTGRAVWFVPDCLSDFPFDGIVAGNGSHVEYRGRVLQDIHFAPSFVRLAYDEFHRKEIPFTLESAEYNYMNARMAEHTLKRFSRIGGFDEHSQALRLQPSRFEIKDNMCPEAADMPIHKISFYADGTTLPYIKGLLGERATLSLEKPDSFGYIYGEAIPAGCCKSNGAALLAGYAGIPFERTVAVGDGCNDVDMIKWAHIGIAMGNSDEELKDIADYICLPLKEGGISSIPELIGMTLSDSARRI